MLRSILDEIVVSKSIIKIVAALFLSFTTTNHDLVNNVWNMGETNKVE